LNFNYEWNLSDLKKVKSNNLKVFSCFSGSGGSTMGYKMAGYNTIGCLEIDPEMLKTYVSNLNPKLPILDSIQTFKTKSSYPEELLNLDILDGSPPCSVFSTCGKLDKKWGSEHKFREGQVSQRLDNLFFDFIDLGGRLKPKVMVAENVSGMLKGKVKGFTKEIINAYKKIGYTVQLFKLNGADMGLPQKRVRVFFIAFRDDLNFPKLKLNFNEPWITFRKIRSNKDGGREIPGFLLKWWKIRKPTDKFFGAMLKRETGKSSLFNYSILHDNEVMRTIVASNENQVLYDTPRYINLKEMTLGSSFPLDYKFKSDKHANYCMGMSVPPLMVYKISEQIAKQWFRM
jgi:DNA (cytosine-5)-methyltransferase 1